MKVSDSETDRKSLLGEVSRVVVKVGTSSITRGSTSVSTEFIDNIAEQVSRLRQQGVEVILVTSGAIGVGLGIMGVKPKPNEIPIKQAAASVGQSFLMKQWNDSFRNFDLVAGQILITMDEYSDRNTVLNLNNTLDSLLAHGVVPIFNENDAICTKEIGAVFGDNDTLSAIIASRADADLLIILTDVEGLYDKNPKIHDDAQFVSVVRDIGSTVEGMAGDATSSLGVGGMKTKIQAAKICQDSGCRLIIAYGQEENIIVDASTGKDVGTLFISDNSISKKRRWLKAAKSTGSIIIDDGAVVAIKHHQSLLPIGIKDVQGKFTKGGVVDIVNKGHTVAKGISNYDSDDVFKIRGLHSDRIAIILGQKTHDDVIISENIVTLE